MLLKTYLLSTDGLALNPQFGPQNLLREEKDRFYVSLKNKNVNVDLQFCNFSNNEDILVQNFTVRVPEKGSSPVHTGIVFLSESKISRDSTKRFNNLTKENFQTISFQPGVPAFYFEIPKGSFEVTIHLKNPVKAKFAVVKFISTSGGRSLQVEYLRFHGILKQKEYGPINLLHKELISNILSLLRPQQVLKMATVCTAWKELVHSNQFWENLFFMRGWIYPQEAKGSIKRWFLQNSFQGEINSWEINDSRKRVTRPAKNLRVLMVGLNYAGKTRLLYKLKLGGGVPSIPTIGFNVESITYKKTNFTIWDIGGQEKIRPLWRHYMDNLDICVWVIDSSSTDRLEENIDEMQTLSIETALRNQKPPLLLILNKQDLLVGKEDTCLKPREWADRLNLQKIRNSFSKIYVQSISVEAQTSEELNVLLDWMYWNNEKKKKKAKKK